MWGADLVPRLTLAVAVAAALAAGGQTVRLYAERKRHAETRAEYAQAVTDWHRESARAVQAARDEETRRTEAVQGVADDAQKRLDGALADAGRARLERERLRKQLAGYAAHAANGGACPGAAAAGAGPASGAAVDVLAELFSRADDAAGELAEALDAAHARGLACERAWAALREPERGGL